jgi:hypothetical protein
MKHEKATKIRLRPTSLRDSKLSDKSADENLMSMLNDDVGILTVRDR